MRAARGALTEADITVNDGSLSIDLNGINFAPGGEGISLGRVEHGPDGGRAGTGDLGDDAAGLRIRRRRDAQWQGSPRGFSATAER